MIGGVTSWADRERARKAALRAIFGEMMFDETAPAEARQAAKHIASMDDGEIAAFVAHIVERGKSL